MNYNKLEYLSTLRYLKALLSEKLYDLAEKTLDKTIADAEAVLFKRSSASTK